MYYSVYNKKNKKKTERDKSLQIAIHFFLFSTWS